MITMAKDIQDDSRDGPSDLEVSLGYRFRDPALLETALTHRSHRFENESGSDNQRLEFLGDAVLGFLLADRVFRGYAEHPEGMLTVLRASIASGVALAAKARTLRIGEALLLGHGEQITGGRERESNLTDALEAVFGAVYLDGGIEAVSGVFDRLFADEIGGLGGDPWMDNPKGRLQSIAQKVHHREPVYETLEETGPKHCARFKVRATLAEGLSAEGSGGTKRTAQSAAAEALLKKIEGTI